MEIFVLSIVTFLIAILTFFSGFGFGTLLTPVFMIFFPVELAIGLTGIVHLFNNLFKLILVGRFVDRTVVIKFGIPAIIAAIVGSWLLFKIPDHSPLFTYMFLGNIFKVYPVKFLVAALLIIFSCIELIPYFNKLQFSKGKLPVGGILSGFFGGLAGVQGALRSAFLINAGLSKEVFIGTAVVVSTLVDLTRLSIYSSNFIISAVSQNYILLGFVVLSGIGGAFIGNILLKKVTLDFVQKIVAVLLIVVSIMLGAGII